MPSYIAIEGPIGVGKTTLAHFFRERLSAETVHDVTDNPFLADFYRDKPQSAFRTQMYFLISRFEQQVAIQAGLQQQRLLVCDYLFAKDKIFAYLNLDDQEIVIYDKYFSALTRYAPTPNLVVYLQAPRDVLLERVRRRNLDYESKIAEAYVDELIQAYDHYFYHYKDSPLLIVNTAEIDFVENREDLKALIQRIAAEKIRGIEYYHPVRKRKR